MDNNIRQIVLDALENEILTEENTDKLISLIFDRVNLPWYVPSAIAKKVLDRMLPDVLLDALRGLLQ